MTVVFKCQFEFRVFCVIFLLINVVQIALGSDSSKVSSCEAIKKEDQGKNFDKSSETSGFLASGLEKWDCEQLNACSDKPGFDAILTLHQKLDDDANGNVDITESVDFLRDELKYENGFERQKGFHRNDKQITPDELWLAWKSSEVHNWTVEETIQWLTANVELPQYAKNFQEHSIDGTALPRLAVNSMHFLSNIGIKDPIHKQKISLKAMDVVLFGPSKNHNYMKDVILTLSLTVAVGGCWFAYMQHRKAHSHMLKTMKDMESLQNAEESLRELQKELDKAKLEQEIVATEKKNLERRLRDEMTIIKSQDSTSSTDAEQSRIQQLEEELRIVLEDLRVAERALQEKAWSPSPALQHWLQLTYELELRNYNAKKAAAEQQLAAAKEGCEKLRKKRSSFLGTFRVAHGNSIDDVDNRILQAKAALSEVTRDLQERLHRWKQIELLCGFSVVQNPGIHHLESILGTSMSGMISSKTSASSRMVRTSSEGTLADDDSASMFGASAIQHLVQNSATLFLAPLPSSHAGQFNNFLPLHFSASGHSFSGSSSLPLSRHPTYCILPNSEQQALNESLINIPYGCAQIPGISMTPTEHLAMKPSDLKSCASSNAILQRADAFCCDPHLDSISNETIEISSFDSACGSEEVSTSGDFNSSEATKPVFTVGGSNKEVLRSPLLLLKRRTQESPKVKESSKLGQVQQEGVNVPGETENQTETCVNNTDRPKDLKKKILPIIQKAKTS